MGPMTKEARILTTVVGSYPIPAWLAATPSTPALNDAILVAVRTQELAGIDVVSDGELTIDLQMAGLDRSLEVAGPIKVISQMLVNGPMRIELLAYPGRPSQGAPSTSRGLLGLTHLSFNVDKVDSAAARLADCGGTILEETRSDAGIVLLFLTDPDGTRVELMGGAG